YNIDFDEEDSNVQIPFMALQVFVENAVLHGIEEKEQGGTINLSIKSRGEDMIITISDDGVGISVEKLCEIRNEIKSRDKLDLDKVGINNVNKRMFHYYGEEYSINIDSKVKKGTKVEIIIPRKL
ncbi:MAG: ATP-binding protein, partial [Clostridium perfringens]|nr:ATP-binding protein [Clostridium perfringens]